MRSRTFVARRALTAVQNPSFKLRCPNSRLFIAGLSWLVDEKSLKDAFSSFGEVTEVKIIYRETGRPRGYGFVQFSKEDDAVCAKDAMDGRHCWVDY